MPYYQGAIKRDSPRCKFLRKNAHTPAHPFASVLVDDVMKKYFCQKAAQCSSCSLFSNRKGSIYSMDKRLLYWTEILEDRKKIACRIQKATGKRISHVLYNQLEDHRNVQNVKRIIDYAQRLDPNKLITRKVNHIHDANVFETLPRSERLQTPGNLEIVGTPKVTQAEQWLRNSGASNNAFLKSNFLHIKLQSKTPDMFKVLEFYPDIDRLQVVGQRIHKHAQPIAECISDFELSAVSSESNLESCDESEFPKYGIQINDIILKANSKPLTYHLEFKCKPFQRQTKTLCKIKNIGRKPVQLAWRRIKPMGAAYLRSDLSAFAFNQNTFRITYGESEDIEVLFMPTERMVRQEQWWLKIEPESTHKILVTLSGECYIPEEFFSSMIWDLLDSVICNIIPGKLCNVRRRIVLTEREIFEKQNPGFKCELEDLRRFNEIYRQIKKKSHPPSWDLNLQTLKELIDAIQGYTQHSKYLNAFMKIIREMRRRIPDCDSSIKVRLIRGLILSIFDKWETKAVQIVNAVAQTEVDTLLIKMPFDFVIEQLNHCETIEEKRKTIQYNALYIQMYCSFCDLAEDLVSFIENCLLLYAF